MHFVPTLRAAVVLGLLDEGTDGPLFQGKVVGKICPELEPHDKLYFPAENLKAFKLYPGLQNDCRLEMHEQRRIFSPKK